MKENEPELDLKKLDLKDDKKADFKERIIESIKSKEYENVKVSLYDTFSNMKNMITSFAKFETVITIDISP